MSIHNGVIGNSQLSVFDGAHKDYYPGRYREYWKTNNDSVLNDRKNNLITLNSVLERYGVTMIPLYGTLLGMVREGELISGDRDDDVGVVISDKDLFTEQALEDLEYLGFEKIRLYAPAHGHQNAITIGRHTRSIDICLFTEYNSDCYMYHEDTHVLNKQYLDNLVELEVWGERFKIPSKAEQLLEGMYGPQWRTPQSGKFCVRHNIREY